MRAPSAILFATAMLWSGWASAQTNEGLPKASLEDAGQAEAFAQFLCNIPGSDIDAFRQKVDALTSGGTKTAEYRTGQAKAHALIDEVRHNGNGDVSELQASTCPQATRLLWKVAAQR